MYEDSENASDKQGNPPRKYQENAGRPSYILIMNATWQNLPYLDNYKAVHAALFFAIVDSINRNNWNPVSLPLDYLLNKIGSCRKAYTDARNWLVEHQILYIKPGRNANQMAVFGLGEAVYKWTSTSTGRGTSTSDLPAHKWTGKGTHYKTTDIDLLRQQTLNIVHDEFYNLYGKDVGYNDSLIAWSELTDEERVLAMEHVPKYIAAKPEKVYRKDPANYLSKKVFRDEVPVYKQSKSTHSQILNQNKDASAFKPFANA